MNVRRVEELSTSHIDDLHRLYQNEWWTEAREWEVLSRMLDGSDELVAFEDSNSEELVAFARVLTDYTYKALVFDVIVAELYRNNGLGERLMEELLEHPRLVDVEHFELYCLDDMVAFYEQWGFTDGLDIHLMRR